MPEAQRTNSSTHQDVFVDELLKWYSVSGRKLSFREHSSPYHVLVSEIMLRKTTAKQVDKVFRVFVEMFPDVNSLASAELSDVERVIRPLGIRSRARHLLELARRIVDEHGGRIPDTYAELSKLPSVGEYVAGCVMTFCYGRRYPLVDTNVSRVLSRVFGLGKFPSSKVESELKKLYLSISPVGREREFHYALLDLSSAFCRPKDPNCKICPIRNYCSYGKSFIF